jgi:hypothetical protein
VALDLAGGWDRRWLSRLGWPELEGAVRPVDVVVVDADAQDAVEVAAVDDQQPSQALGADGPDEAPGDGVCLRRPYGRLDDPDAAATEHLSKVPVYLRSRSRIRKHTRPRPRVEAEVARLLADPGAGRVGRAASEPHAAACVRDEEQHVVAAQEHCLDGEEVAGDDARRLGAPELAPPRDPMSAGPARARGGRAADGPSRAILASRVWQARRRSADGPSADPRVPSAAPRPALRLARKGAHAGRAAAAISCARARDASAAASAG